MLRTSDILLVAGSETAARAQTSIDDAPLRFSKGKPLRSGLAPPASVVGVNVFSTWVYDIYIYVDIRSLTSGTVDTYLGTYIHLSSRNWAERCVLND